MAEHKYTAPPWRLAPHDRYDKEWLILSAEGKVVGFVRNDDICYEEAKANATALASAPTSLETCRDIYRVAEAVGRRRAKRDDKEPGEWWEQLTHLERVLALYAKRALDKAGA